ncbi:hypothetical protein HY346_01090 [Candidatus Microgenomates bacterium]|nr:hypothetical protein [Candidatus Microgenomates bacterium]
MAPSELDSQHTDNATQVEAWADPQATRLEDFLNADVLERAQAAANRSQAFSEVDGDFVVRHDPYDDAPGTISVHKKGKG